MNATVLSANSGILGTASQRMTALASFLRDLVLVAEGSCGGVDVVDHRHGIIVLSRSSSGIT
jgi:hypothetical protein